MSFTASIDLIENRTFSELKLGDSASISRTLTSKDIEIFAIMSGDVNPAHVDEEFAKSDMFHKIIAHGMWGGALISSYPGRAQSTSVNPCAFAGRLP
jgi:acyl dehydratase